jgi:hypothetical protein
VVVALGFFYFRSRSAGTPAGAASPGGSMVNNPAASSIPYVPSVTVTGIPAAPATAVSTPPPAGSGLTAGSGNPNLAGGMIPFYQQIGGTMKQVSSLPFGTKLTQSGEPIQSKFGPTGQQGPSLFIPISGPIPGFVSGDDVSYGQAGQGGWGQAGQGMPLVTAMMGWTSGWPPLTGAYPPGTSLGQRTGPVTAGAGAGTPVRNRTGTNRPRVFGYPRGGGGGGPSSSKASPRTGVARRGRPRTGIGGY